MNARRLFSALIAILILTCLCAALAETPVYIQYGDTGRPIGWLQELLGVEERQRYNYSNDTIPYFGDETLAALEALQREYKLSVTGSFDDETLYLLLDPAYTALDGYDDPLVWIPMYGGACYHLNYWCSGLIEPRQMPESCAEALGFTSCARCFH